MRVMSMLLCSLTCPLHLILSTIRFCSASSSVGLLLQTLRSLGFTHTCLTGHMSFTPRPAHWTSSHWSVECLRAQCLVPRPSQPTQKRSTVFSHSMVFTIMDTLMTHRHTWLLVVRMHRLWHHNCRIVLKMWAISALQATPTEPEWNWNHLVQIISVTAWTYRVWKNVVFGNANVQPVDSVWNLGVHLDSLLDMNVHVTKTTQACFFQLRRLWRFCRLLGHDLVTAMVFMRLDYGNALLAGLPHSSTAPYQHVINAAVRLVNGLWSHDHVTQAAIDLHWLPAEARIQYKLCLLVHHTLAGRAPDISCTFFNPSPPFHLAIQFCSRQPPTAYTCLVPGSCSVSESSESPFPRCGTNCRTTSALSTTLTLSRRNWKHFCLHSFMILILFSSFI